MKFHEDIESKEVLFRRLVFKKVLPHPSFLRIFLEDIIHGNYMLLFTKLKSWSSKKLKNNLKKISSVHFFLKFFLCCYSVLPIKMSNYILSTMPWTFSSLIWIRLNQRNIFLRVKLRWWPSKNNLAKTKYLHIFQRFTSLPDLLRKGVSHPEQKKMRNK